jgi:putative hydrolase of the HAD superfamily
MTLETVFLDAGGVIVFPNWQRVSDALAGHGVSVSAERLERADPLAKKALDVPAVIHGTSDQSRSWPYFNLVLEYAGVAPCDRTDLALADLRRYHDTMNLWETVPDHVPHALRALKARHRLVVVSNANGTLHHAFERLGLMPLVDDVLDSAVEGIEKPDPRLFQIALARSGGKAATTVHVGDMYEIDVAGARAAGIRPLFIDSAGLYPDADCPRYRSLAEVAFELTSGQPA